jgi:curved DNA-binding protein CbpA
MKESWEVHWKDYYKILQIDPSAEPEVVKAAYDKLARKYHPDINKDANSARRMKDLNEAFEILSQLEKRQRYHAVYMQTLAGNRIYTSSTFSHAHQPETKATPSVTPDVIQFRWCSRCKDNANMRIGFVNKKPAFGTCPQCHTTWDLRPHNSSTVNADEIMPDVKRRLEELRNVNKNRNKSKHKRWFG